MAQPQPRCDECRYWILLPEGEQLDSEDPPDDLNGRCHRFPPLLGPDDALIEKALRWQFPMTWGCDWCGEHQPKSGKP